MTIRVVRWFGPFGDRKVRGREKFLLPIDTAIWKDFSICAELLKSNFRLFIVFDFPCAIKKYC